MDPIKITPLPPDCPFLGLKSDPGTSLAYATTANHCFHCKSPAIPRLEHQANYCLSKNYTECRVYQQAETNPFPNQFRQAIHPGGTTRKVWRFVLMVMILMAAAFVTWLSYQSFSVRQAAAAQATLVTPGLSNTLPPPAPTNTQPPPSATVVLPSQTPALTSTNPPTQKHALEVPIQVDGQDFIIHLVGEGEQLVLLARNYNTSIEAILALNYQIPETVWTGSPVVIAPGLAAADQIRFSFSAYEVTENEITVEALAVKLGVDEALFKQYTSCEQGCLLKSGDWVIIPHPAP